MRISVKPWLADRQPSFVRWGAPGDDRTGRACKRDSPSGVDGMDDVSTHRADRHAAVQCSEAPVLRRHVDLMRVSSALCRTSS